MAWNPFKRQPAPAQAPPSTPDVPVLNAVPDDATWRAVAPAVGEATPAVTDAAAPFGEQETPDVDEVALDDEAVEQPAVIGRDGAVALPEQIIDEDVLDDAAATDAGPDVTVIDATALDPVTVDAPEPDPGVPSVPATVLAAETPTGLAGETPTRPRFSAATVIAAAELLHGTHDAEPAASREISREPDAPSESGEHRAVVASGATRSPLVEPLTPTFTAAAVAGAASRLHGTALAADDDATQATTPVRDDEATQVMAPVRDDDATQALASVRSVEDEAMDAVPPSITPVPMPVMSDEERAERERLERERAARREARLAALAPAAPVAVESRASEPKVVEIVREVHPKRITDRFAGSLGLFLLRVAAAAILLVHGLNGWLNNALMQQTWSNTVLPSPGLIARGLPILEAVLALLLLFGLLTRFAGLLVAGIGVVTLAFVMWGRWSIFTPGSLGFLGEHEVLLSAVGLALMLLGAGSWSIDYLARKESQRVE